MHILVFLVFGLLVGAIARLMVPGVVPGGWTTSLVVGVVGAFVGGFFARAFGNMPEVPGTGGFVASLFGAIVVAATFHWIAVRRTLPR